MSWYSIVLLCIISCWIGMCIMALFSATKCTECKIKIFNDKILKCKKCGADNLHITNRFTYLEGTEDFVVVCHSCGTEYEIHNNIKKNSERTKNNEN